VPALPQLITSDFLVVGEGDGDASFIKNLCEVRGIPDFQVEDCRGESKFVLSLKSLTDRTGYDRLKGIIVVSDNDDAPDNNFLKIRGYLKDTKKLPPPDKPLTPVKRDTITVAVMMLPFDKGKTTRGCLETLLLRCIEPGQQDLINCIDAYRTCIDGSDRPKSHEDKFKLRCYIAAKHPDDPNLAVTFAVSPSKGLFDLNHSTFDEITDFLRKFPSLC
jgi:hypothetical protein